MKSRLLSVLQTEVLHGLGLLVVLLLLVAAQGFAAAHPAFAAFLVFLFSLPYLAAAVATKRAHFLYATMLLGAVSYFMTCHALGAPGVLFPVLSVPLVISLWLVGQYLRKQLGRDLRAFPRTTFRAMNITVAVFALWAVFESSNLLAAGGGASLIPGLALLGYAMLYLAHCVADAPLVYGYAFCGFLVVGSGMLGVALSPLEYCWMYLQIAAVAVVFTGTALHRRRSLGWSRHIYICFAVAELAALGFAAVWWPFVLYDAVITAFVFWQAYRWLAKAVGDVRLARSSERLLARCFFLGALFIGIPFVPLVFVFPASSNVAGPALLLGLVYCLVAWSRRGEQSKERNIHVLAAGLLLASGFPHILGLLPAVTLSTAAIISSGALLVTVGALYSKLSGKTGTIFRKTLAEAAFFPAIAAWYIPASAGDYPVALGGAGLSVALSLVFLYVFREALFLCTTVLGGVGIFLVGILFASPEGITAAALCVAAAGLAGACYVRAEMRQQRVAREAATLAWLVLSIAAPVTAVSSGAVAVLYTVAAVGFIAVVMAGGFRKESHSRDIWAVAVVGAALVATIIPLLFLLMRKTELANVGHCFLWLATAHAIAWRLNRTDSSARMATGLFAAAALLIIFGLFPAADLRLLAGSAVTFLLFILALGSHARSARLSNSIVVTGHATSLVFGGATLLSSWGSAVSPLLAAGALAYGLVYGLMPRLRTNYGFRVGAASWSSAFLVMAIAAFSGSMYRQEVLLVALLAFLWLAVGYTLRSAAGGAWSVSLYACSASLAVISGAVSLFSPANGHSWQVLLVCGIVFASLFVILRQDIFAYLVTVSLALMAFDWVRMSTSHFTQDVLFYLVVAVGVFAVFLLLPYLKRLANRLVRLPAFSIFSWQGTAFAAVPIIGMAALLSSAYSLKVTAHPRFCTSCHYMDEYYESWQHSSHQEVACIECHYEPGLKNEVIGKGEGLIQLIKYVSHSYTSRPHGIVSNVSCMRAGCHDDIESNDETLLFRDKIRFRHRGHLSEHPRGKELNCVSCHGQMVQGSHISVTETTCITCHFYGRGDKPLAAGDCELCHLLPEGTVTFVNQSFNHREFLEGKGRVECTHCHSQVTQGDGHVSAVRCKSCHLANYDEIGDQAEFHRIHVSQGHFDCLQCHDEIKHGIHPETAQLMSSTNCNTCHGGERHTVQERVYKGTAVPEIDEQPDFMYVAGVTCDGCHTDMQAVHVGEMTLTSKASGTRQCADCHGDESYGELLVDWQQEIKGRLAELQPDVAKQLEVCQSTDASSEQAAQARKLAEEANAKLTHVVLDGSYGAHNYFYISSILDSVESDLASSRGIISQGGAEQEAQE